MEYFQQGVLTLHSLELLRIKLLSIWTPLNERWMSVLASYKIYWHNYIQRAETLTGLCININYKSTITIFVKWYTFLITKKSSSIDSISISASPVKKLYLIFYSSNLIANLLPRVGGFIIKMFIVLNLSKRLISRRLKWLSNRIIIL